MMFFKLLIVIALIANSSGFIEHGYKLKKVLILSRHHIRSPLGKQLNLVTPKPWPYWNKTSGVLTDKGYLLESYMGKLFSKWLIKEGILPENCPSKDDFFVYANKQQRTKESAKAFISKAFPDCNVTVHVDSKIADSIFNAVIQNDTKSFRKMALADMSEKLLTLKLDYALRDLANILDYNSSYLCKIKYECDLVSDKNALILNAGLKPNIDGPIKLGNSVVDAFAMEYYEGFSSESIAWGQINMKEQWLELMAITEGYHNVIFNTTLVAKDIAGRLINYIKDRLLSETPKVTLLMGHDANIVTLLTAMNFKPFLLPKQYERTPVGGKIVFQKWLDEGNDKNLLKINYVYQSNEQLRNGTRVNYDNPPLSIVMELNGCNLDRAGYCPWSDFVHILENL